jgi:RsiW-degrading membrane proteinase PrsW (M82 family)
VTDFTILFWAITPPLLLLSVYYLRIPSAPSPLRLLSFFAFGAISGFLALGLQFGFETLANSLFEWQRFTRNIFGATLRLLLAMPLATIEDGIAPIEESCKLIAVAIPTYYLRRRYSLRSTTVFLFAVAVSLGFTAQENAIYVFNDTSSLVERIIGTPIHTMFSAPWAYVVSVFPNQTLLRTYKDPLIKAWLNSVICHAVVNLLATGGSYSSSLRFLSYALFPFLLWMFWRLEQLLRRVQGKPTIILVSAYTRQHRYWQRGLILFALMLGGNAIFGMFLLWQTISPLIERGIFDNQILIFILDRSALNLGYGVIAWGIYRYLLHVAKKN